MKYNHERQTTWTRDDSICVDLSRKHIISSPLPIVDVSALLVSRYGTFSSTGTLGRGLQLPGYRPPLSRLVGMPDSTP
jgi:hypothetical protein